MGDCEAIAGDCEAAVGDCEAATGDWDVVLERVAAGEADPEREPVLSAPEAVAVGCRDAVAVCVGTCEAVLGARLWVCDCVAGSLCDCESEWVPNADSLAVSLSVLTARGTSLTDCVSE